MVRGGADSWNVRDRHMAETLDRLMAHHGPAAKAIVWEHNTHIGDARYTDMADDGMVNVGQLVRERHGEDGVVLVGFGSLPRHRDRRRGVGRADGADAGARRRATAAGRTSCTARAPSDKLLLLRRRDAAAAECNAPRPPRDRRGLPSRVRALRQLRADRPPAPLRRLPLHRRDDALQPLHMEPADRASRQRRIRGPCSVPLHVLTFKSCGE